MGIRLILLILFLVVAGLIHNAEAQGLDGNRAIVGGLNQVGL
jgi:hypothetical protein